jgi:hypothetical protein
MAWFDTMMESSLIFNRLEKIVASNGKLLALNIFCQPSVTQMKKGASI